MTQQSLNFWGRIALVTKMDYADAGWTSTDGAIYTDGGYMKDGTGNNVGNRWWNECNMNIMPSHSRSDFGDYVRPYSRSCKMLIRY